MTKKLKLEKIRGINYIPAGNFSITDKDKNSMLWKRTNFRFHKIYPKSGLRELYTISILDFIALHFFNYTSNFLLRQIRHLIYNDQVYVSEITVKNFNITIIGSSFGDSDTHFVNFWSNSFSVFKNNKTIFTRPTPR